MMNYGGFSQQLQHPVLQQAFQQSPLRALMGGRNDTMEQPYFQQLGTPQQQGGGMIGVPPQLGMPQQQGGGMLGVPMQQGGTQLGMPQQQSRSMMGVPQQMGNPLAQLLSSMGRMPSYGVPYG